MEWIVVAGVSGAVFGLLSSWWAGVLYVSKSVLEGTGVCA